MADQTRKKTRAQIMAEMRRIRDECQDILDTCAEWNRRHPDETPIDADPDGRLRRMIAAYDKVLSEDRGTGPIAEPKGIWDGESNEVH